MNKNIKCKKHDIIIAGYLMLVGIVGCILSLNYGKYMDYNPEWEILCMNVKQYLFSILGDKALQINSLSNFDIISNSVELDHGIASYYLAFPLLFLSQSIARYNIWKIYTFLVFYVGALALYATSLKLFKSKGISILLFSELVFTPIIFSHAHYNNKDIAFLSLLSITILCWVRILKSDKDRLIDNMFLAIAVAFLVNCKILGGLHAFILMLGYIITCLVEKKKTFKDTIVRTIIIAIISIFTFLIITPATWPSITKYITHVFKYTANFTRWNGNIKFMGNVYAAGETPWFYLPVMFAITIPLIILVQIILGHVFLLIPSRKVPNKTVLFTIALLWIVPIFYATISETTLYDEWRHFFFIYGPMLLVSGAALDWLHGIIKQNSKLLFGEKFCVSAIVGYLIINLIIGYPNEIAYTNALAGRNAAENFQLDSWGTSNLQAIKSLIDCPNRNQNLAITIGSASGYISFLPILFLNDYLDESIIGVVSITEEKPYNYLFLSNSYSLLSPTVDLSEYHELMRVGAYGNDLIIIYEKNG